MTRRVCRAGLALTLVRCSSAPTVAREASEEGVTFRGSCDASGAVPVGDGRFMVADDEDNVLRLYDGRLGGDPLMTVDVSATVGDSEADFEAAARLGDVAFWLSSHGLNRRGELRRSWFLATTSPDDGTAPVPFGVPYDGLLADLLAEPNLIAAGLVRAHTLAPKSPGGLNIEGMTRHADGTSLLVGFRNPRPEGKALLVTLANPLELVEGGRAKFGDVELLPLDGLGIRALAYAKGRYVISAGAVDDEVPSRLFVWTGHGDPEAIDLDLRDFNPEAIVAWDDREDLLVLSDDGAVAVDGVPCKKLDDRSRERFRGRWLRLP